MESWDNLSLAKLKNEESNKYQMTIGTKNAKAVKTLRDRMKAMFERRRNNIWNVEVTESVNSQDYRLMNVLKLKQIAKSRNIITLRLKKDDIMKKLYESDSELVQNNPIDSVVKSYSDMTLKELKDLCKENGFVIYNNLKADKLIEMLQEYDENKSDQLEINNIMITSRKEDGFINATQLCKAGGKEFKHWKELNHSKLFINELSSVVGIPTTQLIDIKQGNSSKYSQGTWCHPRIAINIAQWVSPKFNVAVSGWILQLLSTGSVVLQRPVKTFMSLTEIDIEAEELEMNFDWARYTNDLVLYMAYIGSGLVKIGFSDSRIDERQIKHTSCESKYDQFRMIMMFRVSSRTIEKTIHDLLYRYNVRYKDTQQKEIFKPPTTLRNFIEIVEILLKDNDLRFQLDLSKQEIIRLKERISELENLLK